MERVYAERRRLSDRYRLDNPGNRFIYEQLRDRIEMILRSVFDDLSSIRVLDLGCGGLFWAEELVAMGVARNRCYGADLLLPGLQEGRRQGRRIHAVAASAAQLPFASAGIDLICQFTMMTSVLGDDDRSAIAGEIMRVVRPGGYVLWYDFRIDNPRNPHTRAIRRGEIRALFSEMPMRLEAITLLPQLARNLRGPLSILLKFFNSFPILRTHYLALIGPKG